MKRLLRYLRFNLVGAMGMVVQLGSLAALNWMLAGHYLLAAGGAVELAVVHNFVWHVNYTWAERGGGGLGRFGRFQMGNGLVSLVGNVALMRLLVQGVGVPVLVANVVAIVCCSVANFWVGEVWAFRAVDGARSVRAIPLGRILPVMLFLLVLRSSSFAQTARTVNLSEEGRLGTDCAYANWFLGPAAATTCIRRGERGKNVYLYPPRLQSPRHSRRRLPHATPERRVVDGAARDRPVRGGTDSRPQDARMTQRYAHLFPDYMASAVGKLDGIMGGMLPANTN